MTSRLLLTLSKVSASGLVNVRAGRAAADVWLRDGKITDIVVDGQPTPMLGDVLLQNGQIDLERDVTALRELAQDQSTEKIGQRYVRSGLVDAEQLSVALSIQLEQRLREILDWAGVVASFRRIPVAAKRDVEMAFDAIIIQHAVATARREKSEEITRTLASRVYRLTEFGQHAMLEVSLDEPQRAMLPLLRRGASVPVLLCAAGQHASAKHLLWALGRLALVGNPVRGSYSTVLRKRQQLRARRAPEELLELGIESSDGEARSALRRLVRQVHPDRFGASAPAELRRVLHDVTGSLISAEAKRRASRR